MYTLKQMKEIFAECFKYKPYQLSPEHKALEIAGYNQR